MKNAYSDEGSYAVGGKVEPVAGAAWHEMFLHQFGDAAVSNADDDGKEQSPFTIDHAVVNELFAVAPKTEEGESGIHEDMHHFVNTHDGLDPWKSRTRDSCQNQDDDSAQDSRVTISGQSFQGINRSWLHRRRHPRGRRPRRRRSP